MSLTRSTGEMDPMRTRNSKSGCPSKTSVAGSTAPSTTAEKKRKRKRGFPCLPFISTAHRYHARGERVTCGAQSEPAPIPPVRDILTASTTGASTHENECKTPGNRSRPLLRRHRNRRRQNKEHRQGRRG